MLRLDCRLVSATVLLTVTASAQSLEWSVHFDERLSANTSPAAFCVLPDGSTCFVAAGDFHPLLVKQGPDGTVLWESALPHWDSTGNALRIAADSLGRTTLAMTVTGTAPSWRDEIAVDQFDDAGVLRWSRTFSGLGEASVRALAIDNADHLYVAGDTGPLYTRQAYLTLKLDPDGQLLWQGTYAGHESGQHSAEAIAVNALGEVVVTGTSTANRPYGDNDVATLKYSAAGELLWVERFGRTVGPSPAEEVSCSLAFDPAGGAYIVVVSYDYTGANALTTLHYDDLGGLEWSDDYTQLAPYVMRIAGVAVDGDGNLIIASDARAAGTDQDLLVIKYDHMGQRRFVATYAAVPAELDVAAGLVIDSFANIFVVGAVRARDFEDTVIVKFDSSGEVVWADRIGERFAAAFGIGLDAGNHPHVSCRYSGNTFGDVLTMRFSSSGERGWQSRYDGQASTSDMPVDLATDASGNSYIVGASNDHGRRAPFVIAKFDSAGQLLWSRREAGESAMPFDVVVDENGAAYVVGRVQRSPVLSGHDLAVIRFDSDGTRVWRTPLSTSSEPPQAAGIGMDAQGDIYAVGCVWGCIRVFKLNSNGALLWERSYDESFVWEQAASMAVSAEGNVFVAGQHLTSNGATNWLTLAFSSDGQMLWADVFGEPSDESEYASGVEAAQDGGAFVAGRLNVAGDRPCMTIARYAADGQRMWVRSLVDEFGANIGSAAVHIREMPDGGAVACGYTLPIPGAADGMVIVKVGADGALQWIQRYDGPGEGGDSARRLALDSHGNIYVTGSSAGITTGHDPTTLMLDPSGRIRWVARASSQAAGSDSNVALDVDRSDRCRALGVGFYPGSFHDMVISSYTSAPRPCEPIDPCAAADLDRDCTVGVSDLIIVLSRFGDATGLGIAPANGDADFDGRVTLEDLAIVLAAFGATCF